MAPIDRPLLTIAIPTYNRSKLLKRSLDVIIETISGNEDLIEVVVSDNHSTDDTIQILNEYTKHKYIKYFVNEENIGFNYNYIKLVDEYANGEFCWVLGDDDFLRKGALSFLIKILKENNNIGYISMNFDIAWSSNSIYPFPDYISNEKLFFYPNFKKLIENVANDGNIFMEFISASIFKTDKIKLINKNFISKSSVDKPYYNMFPHSCYFANNLKEERSLYIEEKIFYANIHDSKGWEENISTIYFIIQPFIYNYYYRNGFSKKNLKIQKKLILKSGIPLLFKKNISIKQFINKLRFVKLYILDLNFYEISLMLLLNKLKNFKL